MIRRGIRRAFSLALRRRDRWEAEVNDEIRLHLALRTEQLIADGVPPERAEAEALRPFGPIDQSRSRLFDAARRREQRYARGEWLHDLRQDLSFALRTFGRQKGWTAITVLTLALGIGATTAVFSVVSSLLIHAVPYPGADRIAVIEQVPARGNQTGIQVAITAPGPVVTAWRRQARSFEAIEPYSLGGTAELRTTADPAEVFVTRILPSFLSFAGERPLAGRVFSDSEVGEHAPVAMLSEGLWRARFGALTSAIGRTLVLDNSIYTIVGIAPATLSLPHSDGRPSDVWLPARLDDKIPRYRTVGRLARGVTLPAAMRELDSIAARTGIYPAGTLPFRARVFPPSQLVSFRDSLLLFSVAVALVLFVACANVAHLTLARAWARSREMAIRTALGAGRSRLLRQLMTESLMLAVAGSAVGMVIGWVALKSMIVLRPPALPELGKARLDQTTLAIGAALAIITGLVFGLMGTLSSARHTVLTWLKAAGPAVSQTRYQHRIRSALVVSAMAFSVMLLVGATLLVRSLNNLRRADLGFDQRGLYSVAIEFPKSWDTTRAAHRALIADVTRRLRTLPSVVDVTMAALPPGHRSFAVGAVEVDGERANVSRDNSSFVDVNFVATNYFRMMRIPLIEGAGFTDTSEAAHQIIINSQFAKARWHGTSPLGRRVRVSLDGSGPWQTIVGVAADVDASGPRSAPTGPMTYSPLGIYSPYILMRVRGRADVVTPVRALVRSMDSTLSVTIESTERIVDTSMASARFSVLLLTAFTTIALALAVIGFYGVMAHSVARRTREIGVRVALGASRGGIAGMILRQGAVLAAIGGAIGLMGAAAGGRVMAGLLYGVAPLDAVSLASGAVVLVAAAALASIVPTRRALAVDPIEAIRAE